MLEAIIQGTLTLFQPTTLLLVLAGTLISLVFGVIPGLSGLISMALFLPFVYKMPPDVALPFLVALVSVGFTGGSITAILINLPGTSGNTATLLDGFPMTQKGEGSRAIGAAVTASMLGGLVGVILSLLMMLVVVPLVLAFRTPELFMLILLGLAFLGVLSVGSTTRGLISGGLGLLASFIGFEAVTGEARFTFGLPFLYVGLGIIPVVLGLFGLSELVDMVSKRRLAISTSYKVGGIRDTLQGAKDVFIHKWLWLRSTIIGHMIGIIPGVGGEIACWIAYGQAKQLSKEREKFGTGCIEGVIAPESANNAKEGAALLTTLAFGIPGSSAMAILLGGFLIVGVDPGPAMLTERLPLSFTLLLGIAFANIVGGLICLVSTRYLVKVASIHIDFLFSAIVAVAFVAAFTVRGDPRVLIIVILSTLLGLAMKRFGYSRPAFLLGFILGVLFEQRFFQALYVHGPFFFVTPISLGIVAIIVILLAYPYLKKVYTQHFRSGIKLG